MSGNTRDCSEVMMARVPVLYPKKQETKKLVEEPKKEETACKKETKQQAIQEYRRI